MAKKPRERSQLQPQTQLVTAGKDFTEHGFVNPAVYHASTVLFETVDALRGTQHQEYRYGRRGTPTSRALESAIAGLEGGHDCRLCPSGLAAVTTTLLSCLKAGDHLLMSDAVYRPARAFATGMLSRLGIETTFFDPLAGAKVKDLIKANTRLVYAESPGSQTMEVSDIPAIAQVAHDAGAIMVIDNTWSGGLFFKPFAAGCDISIQAGTKYIVGHSDAMLGAVTTSEALWPHFLEAHEELGQCAGPDDIYLALRGIRTLEVRMQRHMANALTIAQWLQERPEVERVLYPALPGTIGHELWQRDFTGASGLFSVVLRTQNLDALSAMLEGLELFGMGSSWGGYESLALPFYPKAYRTATDWAVKGACIRFHIGLEHTDDLIADLEAGFARLNAAS